MAITIVSGQEAQADTGGSQAGTLTVTLDVNPTAGNLLVTAVVLRGGTSSLACADVASSPVALTAAENGEAATGTPIALFYRASAGGGADEKSVTWTSGTDRKMNALYYELEGHNAGDALDVSEIALDNNDQIVESGTTATSAAAALGIVFHGWQTHNLFDTVGFTYTNSYVSQFVGTTSGGGSNSPSLSSALRTITSAAAQDSDFETPDTGGASSGVIAIFNNAAAAAGVLDLVMAPYRPS